MNLNRGPGKWLMGVLLLALVMALALPLSIPRDTASASSADAAHLTLLDTTQGSECDSNTTGSCTTCDEHEYCDHEGSTECHDACLDEGLYYPVMSSPPEMVGDTPTAEEMDEVVSTVASATASSFSWRNYLGSDWTTVAKHQGSCGSCWAFAATAAFESVINIRQGNPNLNPDLSEQYILSYLPRAGSCSGGSTTSAYRWIMDTSADGNYANGVIPESLMPYRASSSIRPPLPSGWQNHLFALSNYGSYRLHPISDIAFIKSQIVQRGPVVTYMTATSEFQNFVRTNHNPNAYFPYRGPAGTVNHAVTLVGWKDDSRIPNGGYWIVENSWGTSSGYNGYYNVEYGALNHGSNIIWADYKASGGSRDTTPPSVQNPNPAPGTTGIAANTNISFNIVDSGSGVNPSSIRMTVNGTTVSPTITGTSANYAVSHQPHTPFTAGQLVTVRVNASDNAGNAMSTYSYSFTIASGSSVGKTTVTVTESGTPLANVRVYAYSGTAYTGKSMLTDSTGKAEFQLDPGSYRFAVFHGGTSHWSPTITAPGNTTIQIGGATAKTTVTVTQSGTPVPDARVYAYTATHSYTGVSARTDSAGKAEFEFSSGSYKFAVFHNSTMHWSPTITAPGSTTIEIASPAAKTTVTVTKAGSALSGVRVYTYTEAHSYTGNSDRTDSAGKVDFELEAGRYKFAVYHDGKMHWSPTITAPGNTTITVSGGDTTVTVLRGGTPVAAHWVWAFQHSAYTGMARQTDASGTAVFDLDSGSYRFLTLVDGSTYWSSTITAPGSTTIQINDGVTMGTTVTIRSNGAPLSGLTVWVWDQQTRSYRTQTGTTNTSGYASFDLPSGQYRFATYYNGEYYFSDVAIANGTTTIDIPEPRVSSATDVTVVTPSTSTDYNVNASSPVTVHLTLP